MRSNTHLWRMVDVGNEEIAPRKTPTTAIRPWALFLEHNWSPLVPTGANHDIKGMVESSFCSKVLFLLLIDLEACEVLEDLFASKGYRETCTFLWYFILLYDTLESSRVPE